MSNKFTMFKIEAMDKNWKEAEDKLTLNASDDSVSIGLKVYENPDGDECFRNNMYADRLFGIPKKGSYVKSFTECLCNGIYDFTNALSKEIAKEEYGKPRSEWETTEDNIPIELRNQIAHIGRLLQWTVNSSSWRDGTYYPFDAFEILNELKAIQGYSNLTLYKDLNKEQVKNKNTYPNFKFIDIELFDKEKGYLVIGANIGELFNKAIQMISDKSLDFEETFYYAAYGNNFILCNEEQLKKTI